MSKFTFLCLILFTGQQYAVGFLDHDYEYVEEADAWVRLHMLRDDWANARELCHVEGGLLASPSTSALAEAMLRIMSSHNVREAFTGIHATITEGEYESLDGMPLSKIPLDWANDKPNKHYLRPEHCVVLMNATGKVNDVSCGDTYSYFCRKETALMNASHVCQTTVRGYELEPRTGSCYKFHRVPLIWHNAARVCHAEGGHLVIINSEMESQVLQEIFEKNPKDTIVEAENTDSALIGVWQWGVYNGEWQTVHGETLEEAGFGKWSEESKKDRKNGYAAGIKRTGLLVPIKNYDKYSYICEITP